MGEAAPQTPPEDVWPPDPREDKTWPSRPPPVPRQGGPSRLAGPSDVLTARPFRAPDAGGVWRGAPGARARLPNFVRPAPPDGRLRGSSFCGVFWRPGASGKDAVACVVLTQQVWILKTKGAWAPRGSGNASLGFPSSAASDDRTLTEARARGGRALPEGKTRWPQTKQRVPELRADLSVTVCAGQAGAGGPPLHFTK